MTSACDHLRYSVTTAAIFFFMAAMILTMFRLTALILALFTSHVCADEAPRWLMGRATKLPGEYTNQESTYFSIVEGRNGKLYIGAAKYGVNAYLLEYDPKTDTTKMVVDAMK